MKRPLGSDGLPTPGLDEQELLQRLIKEGLSPSDHEGDADITRYRNLLEVLFQTCILTPIGRSPTPASLDQAGYTLTILSRQTTAKPKLLSTLPPPADRQIPLYKWITPRLILSAVRYAETEGAEDLVEDLISSAVNVLLVLGRDLSDEQTSFAKGPRRVMLALRHMLGFCQGELEFVSLAHDRLSRWPITSAFRLFRTTFGPLGHNLHRSGRLACSASLRRPSEHDCVHPTR